MYKFIDKNKYFSKPTGFVKQMSSSGKETKCQKYSKS